jgi:hypothetical protein
MKDRIFYNIPDLGYTKTFPKGLKARPASLKCCFANGNPIIVIANKAPNNR